MGNAPVLDVIFDRRNQMIMSPFAVILVKIEICFHCDSVTRGCLTVVAVACCSIIGSIAENANLVAFAFVWKRYCFDELHEEIIVRDDTGWR